MRRPLPALRLIVVILGTALITLPTFAQASPIQGRGVCLTQWGRCPLAFPDRTPVNAPPSPTLTASRPGEVPPSVIR
jgi:hypothetical protein